jgi:shikimate dehydrogenase
MTRHLAVLGSPIEHSKSPSIHEAAYRTLQLNWDYSKLEIKSNHLLQFIETLDSDWLGLSLTMPLKEEAASLANEKSALVLATGVANTLLRTTTGWTAHNTDVFGIQRALETEFQTPPKSVSIIGSGATATSAVFAIADSYPDAKITVFARNFESAADLKDRAKASSIDIRVKPLKNGKRSLLGFDLVISTLPSGALDSAAVKLRKSSFSKPKGVLLDVAYHPWPSELASTWSRSTLTCISGIEMLIWQAIGQIRIFNHNDISVELPNERAVELSMRHSLGLI